MAKKPLAPRQARSRESERRLLQAAVEVLTAHGLEGTTIPRIAAQAGLTPGAVYRRFPNKTALLETMLLKALESSQALLKRTLTPEMAREQTLPALLDPLIASLIESYRTRARLLRGLRQLVQTSDHQAFRNKAVRIEKRTLEYTVEVLLSYRQDIRHPDPQLALSFALVTLSYTLLELFLVDAHLGTWPAFVPEDDVSLRRELKRMFLRYLGCDSP
jgi:AcrR family transcriptional regulator